ncbi:MAG TPA: hypothetical protein PKH43_06480 [Saprospiraceae bacterium]|nr:hypothetical protein [Saprospiraceae bacterium]
MKNKALFLTLLLAFALSACQKANDKNPMLLGHWAGKEWLVFGKPSGQDASLVSFDFDENGAYRASFGDQKQQGTWRTDGDKLYTTETGKKEIMVKLITADGSTLKFEMKRGGQQETLELTKTEQ